MSEFSALLFLLFSCGGGSSSGGDGGGGDGGGDGNGDGVKVPISSEEANSALLKVIDDPTDENFDNLMDTIADLDDSKASCLYKAAGELLAVYRSQPLSEIMDNFGLEVGIETNFDALTMQHNLSRITYDYLKKAVISPMHRACLPNSRSGSPGPTISWRRRKARIL